jgi:hypothetical protein
MGSIESFYFLSQELMRIIGPMGNDRDRVISITLSEAEWQAFVARQPQPVDWLRQQIRSQVEVTPPRKESQSAA